MESPVEPSDIALMLQVRKDDAVAFEVLHERYQRRLLNFFYGMSRHAPTANDLCQETFLRVWQVRRRYSVTGSFAGYLFGIARMVWREHCRTQSKYWRQQELPETTTLDNILPASGEAPDYRASCNEAQCHILEALQELPEEQRMVFVMRTIRGFSLEDIAEAMDWPVNTVRSRKILGIKRLRCLLDALFHKHEDRILKEER